jgi:hypothetical protein
MNIFSSEKVSITIHLRSEIVVDVRSKLNSQSCSYLDFSNLYVPSKVGGILRSCFCGLRDVHDRQALEKLV